MARRVRANKSLIKQRYHVAKVAFPDDADLAQPGRPPQRGGPLEARRGPRSGKLGAARGIGFLDVSSIPKWLRGLNAHLGDRRPIDVIRQGRLSEVIAAIEAEKAGAFA